MVTFDSSKKCGVYDLQKLVALLRSPEGCPWDREQTHASIRRNLLEEAYEAAEAIDEGDPLHLQEELGDLLTQIVFHSELAAEAGAFTLDDVADAVVRKLLYRHPHVFGDVTAGSSDEVLRNWDELKRREKSQDTATASLAAVARSLPALWRAEKVQKRAAKVGFDWPEISGALAKLREETDELELELERGDEATAGRELGDILFCAVNLARFLRVDPEDALTESTEKFIARFGRMENLALQKGHALEDLNLDRQEELYMQAKQLDTDL